MSNLLSIYISIYLSIQVVESMSVTRKYQSQGNKFLSIYFYLSLYLSISLSIYLGARKHVCNQEVLETGEWKTIYLSICLSIYLCIYLSIYISIYLSIYLSNYLSIYLGARKHVCNPEVLETGEWKTILSKVESVK